MTKLLKPTDSRTANWDGLGQVELDAVKPEMLQELCTDAIKSIFEEEMYHDLLSVEREERTHYRESLRVFVNNLKD